MWEIAFIKDRPFISGSASSGLLLEKAHLESGGNLSVWKASVRYIQCSWKEWDIWTVAHRKNVLHPFIRICSLITRATYEILFQPGRPEAEELEVVISRACVWRLGHVLLSQLMPYLLHEKKSILLNIILTLLINSNLRNITLDDCFPLPFPKMPWMWPEIYMGVSWNLQSLGSVSPLSPCDRVAKLWRKTQWPITISSSSQIWCILSSSDVIHDCT